MTDLIRREDAIKAIGDAHFQNYGNAIMVLQDIPSAEPEPEEFEWCSRGENPCKEYDQEKHCCHRWTKFIRQTVEELKANERTAKVVHKLQTHIVTPKSTTVAYETETNLWTECGNCGVMGMYHGWKYCPNCGAKLEWSEGDE